jgi:hypothetical protein
MPKTAIAGYVKLDLPETLRRRRGHDFYVIPEDTPGLYDDEDTPIEQKVVYLKLFSAAGDWWITEVDRVEGYAFGYVRLAAMPEMAEWGSIWLPELEEVQAHGGLVIIERDCFWTPRPFGELGWA